MMASEESVSGCGTLAFIEDLRNNRMDAEEVILCPDSHKGKFSLEKVPPPEPFSFKLQVPSLTSAVLLSGKCIDGKYWLSNL